MHHHDKNYSKQNPRAILFMVGAASLAAVTSLLAKTLGLETVAAAGLHPFQISAARFFFAFSALCIFLAAMPKSRPTMTGANWKVHLIRSICGWLGITAMFAAVTKMPIADATAVSFLSPLVTMGLAVIMLNEHLGIRKIIAAGFAISGAVLILKPGLNTFQYAGFFALAAAGFMGLEGIFIKRLVQAEPAIRVLFINNAIGATVSLVAVILFWTWPTSLQWSLMAILGAVMILSQSMFIQAMKRGEASFVIPAFYSVLAFATLYDFIIFRVVPEWSVVLGAAIIISSAFFLVSRGSKQKQDN